MEFELRPWKNDDLNDLIFAANNFRIAQFMTDSFAHPYTRESGEKFLAWTQNNCPSKMLAIIVEGKAVGNVGIHPQSDILCKNAEIGYWIAEEYWGKGIMTEAIKRMIPIAFETYPITRIFGRVFGHNLPSRKVIEKAGFKLEGRFEKTIFKNGEFIDELIYAFRR
ncbi:MAG: GNAT family protein [Chitinophagaceae bacterium]|jgi:RimJ/RimL family protein N-acetyltransferase